MLTSNDPNSTCVIFYQSYFSFHDDASLCTFILLRPSLTAVSHSHCIHHNLQKHDTLFEDMHTAHMQYSDSNELFVTKNICVLHK